MKIAIACMALSAVLVSSCAVVGPNISDQRANFENPPEDCRIMMRWWWFGPAVTNRQIEREMELMKEGGIGGFEVQPVYPLELDDAGTGVRNFPFLSEEFLAALRFASERSRSLGMRMDVTLGSGWPFGGPSVEVRDAAGMLRIERAAVPEGARRLPLPAVGAGEEFLAAFLCPMKDRKIVAGQIRELEQIPGDVAVLPEGLSGAHEALFFISSRSGMMVKRPAMGAEGFVLNHYNRAAVERYLKNVGDRLVQALRPNAPYAIFCDSLEVYQSDWTEGFFEEFSRRRGYDLRRHLPALAVDLGPETPAIRRDWALTLTELFDENFMAPVHEWSQKNETLFRVQGYGIPPATLGSNADADLSEGEGAQWKMVSASRWASSANHLFGRGVTSSETWTWLHSPVFRATPLDMKAEANLHFLQGVNQLIGHGWPYSPEKAVFPGWRFYAAGVFNDRNPWWIVMPDLALYLQRSSYMLRQGEPVNDVAFYLPVSDAYAGFRPGNANLIEGVRSRVGTEAVGAVLEAGFNLDFIDDDVFRSLGRIDGDSLVVGSNRYRAVVIPNVERIPTDIYRTLADFAASGGRIIATRRQPALAPGFADGESEDAEIRRISRELFSSPSQASRFVEDEKTGLGDALREMVPPDVVLSPATPDVGFVHRKTGGSVIYFLANTSGLRRRATASFRDGGTRAEWWDPMSGRTWPAAVDAGGERRVSVALDLEPYEGRFLVFVGNESPQPDAIDDMEKAVLDLSNNWNVTFGSGEGDETMEQLRSWIDLDTTRYFSGTATYEKSVSVPGNMLQAGMAQRLDLGEGRALEEVRGRSNGMRAWFEGPVREAAVVYVNGRRAGSAWCPPYSIDITGLLKPGENIVRIQVANTAINDMAGRALPDYRLLNQRYGKRFDPQDMDKIEPVDSGLFGPIRIIASGRD